MNMPTSNPPFQRGPTKASPDKRRRPHGLRWRHAAGVTLVELMIALVLGLVVTGAAIALFSTNRRTYQATEELGRIQENVRAAYELMARDLREGAGNACGSDVTLVNVVKTPAARWYSDWAGGIRAYDGATAFADAPFGTGRGQRIAGTDAIELKSAVNDGVPIVQHVAASAQFKLNTANHGFVQGDIAVACDPAHAAILQVTGPASPPGTNVEIVHNVGTMVPGNCTKGLGGEGVPAACTANGIQYTFGCFNGDKDTCATAAEKWPAVLARLRASRWYVGGNGRGGRSLYQSVLVNDAGTLSVVNQEIAEGVGDLQIGYLLAGAADYVDANPAWAATDMARVVAVRLVLQVEGRNRVGTDGQPLSRTLEHVVTFRNRAP